MAGNVAERAGEAVADPALYAGLGYSESKGKRSKKQKRGRWHDGSIPGICGVPVPRFIEAGNPPRVASQKEDNRNVQAPNEALEEEEEEFMHSGWNVRRRRVISALAESGCSGAVVSRYVNCGSRAWVWRNKHDGRVAVRADYCRSRFCVRCARGVACRARASIEKLVEGSEPRLVTLTVAHSRDDSLAVLVTRLLEAFKAMRREPLWNLRVKGGAFVLEIKYNHNGGGWHPHLHVLCDASFLPVEQLGPLWRQHAGSGDFNVKQVWDKTKVAGYVAKYITKAFDGSVFHHHDKLVEAIKALKGRRTMSTFGAWRGVELVGDEKAFDKEDWKPLCRLVDVLSLAREGAPHALRVLRLLADPRGNPGDDTPSD